MENSGLTTLAADVRGLDVLRKASRDNSPEALKAAAKQFEAMFLQVVIKSMREASPGDELFGGQESKMYQDMLDQQWAQVMTEGGGTGLARVMERQLAANAGSADTSKPIDLKPLSDAGLFSGSPFQPPTARNAAFRQSLQAGAADPVVRHRRSGGRSAAACECGRTGPRTCVCRARVAGRPVGQPCDRHPGPVSGGPGGARNRLGPGRTHRCRWFSSNNLFNIKAGSSWQGQPSACRRVNTWMAAGRSRPMRSVVTDPMKKALPTTRSCC
jgi:flagellar protein FlgJ